MTPHGHFHWNELMTRDVEGSKAFYGATVGWTYQDMPMPDGTYTLCMDGETPVGGMFDVASHEDFGDMPTMWMGYVAVDDIDACVAKAEKNGGKIIQSPFDVPEVGRIAMIQQPDGAMIGWMTPAPMPG